MKRRPSFLAIWLFLTPVFSGAAASTCEDGLSAVGGSSQSTAHFSDLTIRYWQDKPLPLDYDFDQWAASVSPQYENGLPTYESRPKIGGFTNWAIAFGRQHPLDQVLIEECRRQESISQQQMNSVSNALDELKPSQENSAKEDELLQSLLDLSARSQYYREMREVMSGEMFPFPGQSIAQIESAASAGQPLVTSIPEFYIRLRRAEAKLPQGETAPTEAAFYRSLLKMLGH